MDYENNIGRGVATALTELADKIWQGPEMADLLQAGGHEWKTPTSDRGYLPRDLLHDGDVATLGPTPL